MREATPEADNRLEVGWLSRRSHCRCVAGVGRARAVLRNKPCHTAAARFSDQGAYPPLCPLKKLSECNKALLILTFSSNSAFSS